MSINQNIADLPELDYDDKTVNLNDLPELEYDPVSALNASVFEDQESTLVKQSRQQEGENSTEFFTRHVADSFERGVVSGIDFFIADDFIDKARSIGGPDVATRGMNPNESYFFQNPSRLMNAQELSGHRNAIRSLFFSGSEPLPPTGDDMTLLEQTVRATTAGTEAASDLSNFATSIPRTVVNMVQSILPAAVSDTVVLQTADAISDSDMSASTKQNILMGLGVTAGITTGVAQSPITASFAAYKSVKGNTVENKTNSYLKGEQARFAQQVIDSQGDFHNMMEKALEIQNNMGGEPLKIVPIVAALQNDIMKGKFLEYYSDGRDPTFRAYIDDAVEEFVTRQDAYLKKLAVPEGFEGTLPKSVIAEQANRTKFEIARQQNIQNKIDAVDTKMYQVTTGLTNNNPLSDIGSQAKGLLDQKRTLVRKRLGPLYEDWKKTATESGVVLGPQQVSTLLNFVTELPNDMGRFLKDFSPLLDVKKKTKTETTTTQGLFTFDRAGQITQGPSMSTVDVVDSYTPADILNLKDTVNGRIRDLTGTTDSQGKVQLKVLNDFKKVISGVLEELPDGYGAALKDLDLKYYTEMGIPFNSAGVSKMSVNKFTSTVAQDLTRNSQVAKDFLFAVGEEGIPVLKDAIYTKIHSKAIKGNDVANEKAIKNWLADAENSALVDMVPNLREELTDGVTALSNAREVKARLEVEYKTNAFQATDDFLKSVGRNGLDTTVAKLIGSQGNMSELLPLFKHMDSENVEMFKTGIRIKLTDRALKSTIAPIAGGSKHNAVNFVQSNRAVFDEFFGPEYSKNLEGAMEMFDIVSTIDTANVPFRNNTLSTELFQKETGVGLSNIAAAYRRTQMGIQSTAGAVTGLGSKVAQVKLDVKKQARLMDLLTNPSVIAEMSKQQQNYSAATGWQKAKEAIVAAGKIVARNSLRGSFIGAREATLDKMQDVKDDETAP